jgi:hypothetical protein
MVNTRAAAEEDVMESRRVRWGSGAGGVEVGAATAEASEAREEDVIICIIALFFAGLSIGT